MSRPESQSFKRPKTLEEIREFSLRIWRKYKRSHSNPALNRIDGALSKARLNAQKQAALE